MLQWLHKCRKGAPRTTTQQTSFVEIIVSAVTDRCMDIDIVQRRRHREYLTSTWPIARLFAINYPPNARRSALNLPECLVDVHGDRQHLAAAAVPGAAHRRGAEVVEAGRDPHMGVGR